MPLTDPGWPNDWAAIYDQMDIDRAAHIGFYAGLADGQTCSLLDLGCGTGSITMAVAARMARGARVVGVDLSTTMIHLAQSRAPQHDWRVGDLAHPPVTGHFDLIMVCFHTLQMLLDPADFAQAMRSAAQHLTPQGRFAFDIYQPNPDWLAQVSPSPSFVRQFTDDHGRQLDVIEVGCTYDPTRLILSSDWTLQESLTHQPVPLAPMTLRVRQYFPAEVQAMLAHAGLVIDTLLGDFDGSAFTAASKRQVYVCRLA